MGKASGHPIKWSMIVRMCWFPDVEMLGVTRSMAIYPPSAVSNLCFHLFPFAKSAVCNVLADFFVHSIPVVLPFDEIISPVDA